MSVPSAPAPAPARAAAERLDPARVRAWLVGAIAALLVLTYLSAELTYASAHLPPSRYAPVDPGGLAHGKSADFRLLSLRQTEKWGHDFDGQPGPAQPDAVWVVAQLEVTPREHEDYLLCTLSLVSTDGRAWEAEGTGPTHEGESCAPDPQDVQIGTTYPFVLGFQIPISEADHVAGLGLDLYSWKASPLLRPGS